MAPLIVDNWGAFTNDLNAVKAYGVDAVSVDVWWGLVEASGDNQFSWGYYDQLFATITNAGLDVQSVNHNIYDNHKGYKCRVALLPFKADNSDSASRCHEDTVFILQRK